MKQTLLELVQSILSSMDSDGVNSISDTVESYQIALTIRDVYYDMAVELALKEHEGLVTLTASADPTKPVMMTVPTNVARISFIKYNNQLTTDTHPMYRDVAYCDYDEFIQRQQGLFTNTGSNVEDMSFTGADGTVYQYTYLTDRFPTWYTTADQNTILFDAVNTDEDTTLQSSKTMCGALYYPAFTLEDTFIPVLDANQFPYLRNRAKARSFNDFKQTDNKEAISEAKRQKSTIQRNRNKIDTTPAVYKVAARYGRKSNFSRVLNNSTRNGS